MKINTRAVGLVLSFLLISGCNATTGSSSLQREVDNLRMEVADLKASGRLSDMREGGDINSEINYLRTEVQQLSSNIEGADEGGLTLRQQLDSLNARLDRLERKAGATTSNTGRNGSAVSGDVYQPPKNAPAVSPVAVNAPPPPPVAPLTPYEEGRALYDQKQYRAAINQFKSYLSAEPKGAHAAAAQFHIGESLYALKQYEEAILEYQKVVQGFPKSNQVPTSLLQQGLSFQAIGDKDSAKLLYQKVARDFPSSWQAGLANSRLKAL